MMRQVARTPEETVLRLKPRGSAPKVRVVTAGGAGHRSAGITRAVYSDDARVLWALSVEKDGRCELTPLRVNTVPGVSSGTRSVIGERQRIGRHLTRQDAGPSSKHGCRVHRDIVARRLSGFRFSPQRPQCQVAQPR